ncbi:MAG: M6 family metalloprotease domain-containing protein [Candidatus Amulumruptor caecigallinarius]|nr:M6 family metalloprotease domain-containing protein [Candidatus Amulumruptor caecigallinarius]
MKKGLKILSMLAIGAGIAFQANAVPAKRGVLTVQTADGTELRVKLGGDEFYHQYFTEDGYPLLEKNGNFYYCDITETGDVVDSGIKAGDKGLRGAPARDFLSKVSMANLEQRVLARSKKVDSRLSKLVVPTDVNKGSKAPRKNENGEVAGPPYELGYGLFPEERGSRFPSYGDQKAIVILVEYTDTKFNTSYDAGDYFTRMLNQDGFNDYGGTGCAAEFFRLNSNNAFRPEFDVYGPVTLAHNMAYYGGNDWSGNDQRPEQMVLEACQLLDSTVDFSQFDRDGDGYVDNVFIFYAGRGEASGGAANTVWPHAWNLGSANIPESQRTFDGVVVDRYGCSNEWEGNRPDGVGTFVHEFSHVMGLPDLYATSYTDAFTPGSWSALDYGPYNNDGMTPPLYGAFERYALGWMKPLEIDRAVSATLPSIGENKAGVIRTAKDTEFFLVENRQKVSWDKYIPGHGMLVWHIDYNSSKWTSNVVNNTSSHQYVDIEEADGTQTEGSRAGDAFPGTANKTEFTANTKPAMKTWSNTSINYPLTGITETPDGLIKFDILGGGVENIPEVVLEDPTEVSPDGFTINWTPVEGCEHFVSVYTRSDADRARAAMEGNVEYLPGYQNYNAGSASSLTLSGLEAEKIYYYTVTPSSGWTVGEPSEERSVVTGRMNVSYYTAIATEATEVKDNSFDANWEALADATDYELTVYVKVPGEPYQDVNGFDDGVNPIAGGWTSNSKSSYGMEAYSGVATPSLRLGANGDYLQSPVYADGISKVSFWHRGNNTTDDVDGIRVLGNSGAGWNTIAVVPVLKTQGGKVSEVEIPADVTSVRLEFARDGGKGALAIDDVTVYHGLQTSDSPLPGYDSLLVGNVLTHTVSELESNTEYYYRVRATDGEYYSRPSAEIAVKTTDPSGVTEIGAANSLLTVNNDTVSVSGNELIIIDDVAGRTVAQGFGMVKVSDAGVYLVRVPSLKIVRKIIVK